MAHELRGRTVAILAADGVERVELDLPRGALYGAGATVELAENSSIPVIASGGIAKLEDIVDLKAVSQTVTGAGILGAITGRAIYEGQLDLTKAQAYCDGDN